MERSLGELRRKELDLFSLFGIRPENLGFQNYGDPRAASDRKALESRLKIAYHQMASKVHPDQLQQLPEALARQGEELFKELKNAYDLLIKSQDLEEYARSVRSNHGYGRHPLEHNYSFFVRTREGLLSSKSPPGSDSQQQAGHGNEELAELRKELASLEERLQSAQEEARREANLRTKIQNERRSSKSTPSREITKEERKKVQDLYQKATARFRAGQFVEALSLYNQLLLIQPAHSWALYDAGIASLRMGDYSLAGSYLAKACAQDEKVADKIRTRAEEFYSEGAKQHKSWNPELAIRAYRSALALEPTHEWAAHDLAITYRKQGKTAEAVEALTARLNIRENETARAILDDLLGRQ